MGLYQEIDIALDVFPWSGHTTTCEALSMGVPVVTLRGNRFSSRMVAGVLEFLGGQGWRADALTALPSLLDDTTEGQALREEAQVAAKRLPTWADCAAITARELEALCARE